MHESDEADDAFAHQKLVEAVENQLKANQPEAAQATLNMLTLVGYSREDSLDLMAQVLAHSISLMLEKDEPFDLAGYEQALRRLPELPGAQA
ncbi:hypothetical protein SAMN05216421_0039 [Halopseudomonas xinjiangensis]|uniref:Uncharacterized protein n=1 Tax=Halopseudomonas xinjiangensis TaxID=487184 RepID=A0A1H1L4D0_9GAMM|nr:hypothetical protein [Halopseudomonas xinjiangensis]SDR69418.1 hypothetical protein SAMN05216421_0039 [Halopseudomonas xinjiangensis]